MAFALWAVLLALLLALLLAFQRAGAMRRDSRAINTFRAMGDAEVGDAFSGAHLNTLEYPPLFAVVHMSAL
jgi:hypothetical protein